MSIKISEPTICVSNTVVREKHPSCKGFYNEWTGDYDCGYSTTLACDECKYGVGRKDPQAKCNQPD